MTETEQNKKYIEIGKTTIKFIPVIILSIIILWGLVLRYSVAFALGTISLVPLLNLIALFVIIGSLLSIIVVILRI